MELIQYLIFSAVVVSNAQWEWTPNGYLAGLIGTALAFVVTVAVTRLADALRLRVRHVGAHLCATLMHPHAKAILILGRRL